MTVDRPHPNPLPRLRAREGNEGHEERFFAQRREGRQGNTKRSLRLDSLYTLRADFFDGDADDYPLRVFGTTHFHSVQSSGFRGFAGSEFNGSSRFNVELGTLNSAKRVEH